MRRLILLSVMLLAARCPASGLEFFFEANRIVVADKSSEQFVYPDDTGTVPLPANGCMRVLLKDGAVRQLLITTDKDVVFRMFSTEVHLEAGGSVQITGATDQGTPQLSVQWEKGGMGVPGKKFDRPQALTLFMPRMDEDEPPGFVPSTSFDSPGMRPLNYAKAEAVPRQVEPAKPSRSKGPPPGMHKVPETAGTKKETTTASSTQKDKQTPISSCDKQSADNHPGDLSPPRQKDKTPETPNFIRSNQSGELPQPPQISPPGNVQAGAMQEQSGMVSPIVMPEASRLKEMVEKTEKTKPIPARPSPSPSPSQTLEPEQTTLVVIPTEERKSAILPESAKWNKPASPEKKGFSVKVEPQEAKADKESPKLGAPQSRKESGFHVSVGKKGEATKEDAEAQVMRSR